MLADRFVRAAQTLQAQVASLQAATAARDALIQTRYPALNGTFVTMVDTVSGVHPKLDITKTIATDNYTNHTFTSLAKTIVRVRSTLYGAPESVTFTPQLEFVARDQFGAIRVATNGFTRAPVPESFPDPFDRLLARGLYMYDLTNPQLGIPGLTGYERLTEPLLEQFLALLFIRL